MNLKRKIKGFYRYLFYILLKILKFITDIFPRQIALNAGKMCGSIAYLCLPHYRRIALRNMERVFPVLSKKCKVRIIKDMFRNLGMNLFEWLRMDCLDREGINSLVSGFEQNKDKLERLLQSGKGVIILTGHFGNWEYLAGYMALNGFGGAVVGRRIYYGRFNELICRLRRSLGVRTIYRDDSPREMLRVLNANGLLGILPDQDTDKVSGIFIKFFGYDAYTPTGPVSLAMASGAPILPCFMIREGTRYRIEMDEPIFVPKGENKDTVLKEYTQRWSNVLEKYILRYPEQWVWLHKRWRGYEDS